MPADLGTLITTIISVGISFASDVIQAYWPYILGIVVLVGLGMRFKRLVGLSR